MSLEQHFWLNFMVMCFLFAAAATAATSAAFCKIVLSMQCWLLGSLARS